MRSTEVIVIGAGASGMMAAIEAAKEGAHVIVLEKMKRCGKKLLATGNGRCNYTNEYQDSSCYRSLDGEKAWHILQQFDKEQTISYFKNLGIYPKAREGYYYPASGQAASVAYALERAMHLEKVEIHCEEAVTWMERRSGKGGQNSYYVETEKGSYLCRQLVIATGGMAAPVHGTTGDGYSFAKKCGHTVTEVLPALSSLSFKNRKETKQWTGVRVNGSIHVYADGKLLAKDAGELQMVAYGISGIPVFQVSRFVADAIRKKKTVTAVLDFMPEMQESTLVEELVSRRKNYPSETVSGLLNGLLHEKLTWLVPVKAGVNEKKKASELSEDELRRIVQTIKGWKDTVTEVTGFEKAQVTCGGVLLSEVDEHTMESVLSQGLYLTGELLDVDGICGGYNLQWAWCTGYLAGTAIRSWCSKRN